jgi:hypothetical protein
MTMWLRGIGWGWDGCIEQGLVMVALWGAVITAIVLALGHFTRAQSNPSAPRQTGLTWAEYMGAEGFRRSDPDDGEWHRRLM